MNLFRLSGHSRLDISGRTRYNSIIKIVKEIATFNEEKTIKINHSYKEDIT